MRFWLKQSFPILPRYLMLLISLISDGMDCVLIQPERFTRLVTQLKWRLLAGSGQALYEIGVSDSGQLIGLSRKVRGLLLSVGSR